MGIGSSRRIAFVAFLALAAIGPRAAADAPESLPPEFDNQILPILTKAGCNAGACHGAAIGRGGFQLSLYGQDPALDWERIVRHFGGRRISFVDPEQSLLLRKAGEFIEHGGGQPLDPEGEDWQTLVDWIGHGAPRSASAPALLSIHTEPKRISVERISESAVAFRVLATMDDGSHRDLTPWAVLTSLDPQSLAIGDSPGTARLLRPGRHVLLVRVRDKTTAVEVLCPERPVSNSSLAAEPGLPKTGLPKTGLPKTGLPKTGAPGTGLIDGLIHQRLAELGIPAAPLADDASFLRRVTLDLTGHLPSVEEVQRFARDRSPHKRLRTIDSLLATPAATAYWTHRLMVALRAEALVGRGGDEVVASHYQDFLRAQWTAGTPLPELLATLITASGTPQQNGAVGFYLSAPDARAQTELFSELVLGARMRCANCHDHPLDRWTQEDYHGLAALFAGVRRGREVAWYPGATNINPATGDPALPRLPDGTEVSVATDPRSLLADFVRGRGAPLVARAWVNRIWADLFGRGLVDPVDDLRGSNPATHPALLEALAEDWQRHDFDLRYLIREIARSDAYGRASRGQTDLLQSQAAEFYAHRTARPLSPPVLLDAIADVTSLEGELSSSSPQQRAIAAVSLNASSAPTEQCGVTTACPEDLRDSLAGRLAIIAGPLVNGKIEDPQGVVQHWANDPSIEATEVIEQLYLRCLSRMPRPDERQYWLAQISKAPELGTPELGTPELGAAGIGSAEYRAAIEDMVWSLLTSHQFMTNH